MDIRQLIELINDMTLEEKIGQMVQLPSTVMTDGGVITGPDGVVELTEEMRGLVGSILGKHGAEALNELQKEFMEKHPHHIPLLMMKDVINGMETIFPIPLAQGCTFSTEMVEKAAQIAAAEASVTGLHVTFSPMVDLVRDARWGRVMESTGEDPWLNGELGKAMVRGYQGRHFGGEGHVAACFKHFAAYGAPEGGRDYGVEAVYLNMPNENVIRNTDLDEGPARELPKQIEAMLTGIRMLKTTDDKTTKIYRCQTGHRYYFDGVTVDVVLAQEQLEFNCYDQNKYVGDFNTSSTALLFTTDTNHKIFTAGDSNESNTSYIMEAYGSTCPSILSNVNVFVAFHHGHNTVKSFTTWLKPNTSKFDYVLCPSSVNSIEDRIEQGAYTELSNKANQSYTFSDGLKTILNFTNSGITVTRE